MTSEFRFTKNLEWCPKLPSTTWWRKSPVFLVNGNEWFFRFAFENSDGQDWYYNLYLEVKCKKRNFERCRLKIEIGFKEEETLSLFKGTRSITKPGKNEIWFISASMLASEYLLDNGIKFLFCFDDMAEHLIGWRTTDERRGEERRERRDEERRERRGGERRVSPDLRSNFHLEALSRDFSKLLDDSYESDIKITCENKTFNTHKIVLKTRSAVFSAMLESNMVEGETGLIKVEGFDASIFQSFLRYLYSGTLPELNTDSAMRFYEISDKYAVEELNKTCSDFLVKNLSTSNACKILVLADQHMDQDFRKRVISYIVDKKIPQRDSQWADFCENFSKLALEVQNNYMKKYFPK